MQLILLLAAACMILATPEGQDLQWCGGQRYDASQYICYDNELLCPYLNGAPLSRCGDACYWSFHYNCTKDGQLTGLEQETGLFSLLAVNPAKLVSARVEACGQAFFLKEDGPCTYCPSIVEKSGGKCPAGDQTVLGGGGLNTLVPGGQRYYVDPNTGALRFTQAHSGSEPIGAIHDIQAFEKGAFQIKGSEGWMACPTQTGSTLASPQILAKLPNLSFAAECFQVSLLTVDWKGQEPSAWQYT